MKKLDETLAVINKVEGVIKFLGGNYKEIAEIPFGDIVDTIIRNGGSISINITNQTYKNPKVFCKTIENQKYED